MLSDLDVDWFKATLNSTENVDPKAYTDSLNGVSNSLSDYVKQTANEPSMGLFYMQEHVRKSATNVVEYKKKMEETKQMLDFQRLDVDEALEITKKMKEVGPPAFFRMQASLYRATAAAAACQKDSKGRWRNSLSGGSFSSGGGSQTRRGTAKYAQNSASSPWSTPTLSGGPSNAGLSSSPTSSVTPTSGSPIDATILNQPDTTR
ncbi:hypothetical protein CYMTET_5070 [Cymbomonas tetramitiformis]|uniref:Uncharacterized protein n=1 Tax=Cymbomonas tetramitiformis TaxID=36881 RepID=A0AAE0LJG2_9CHLO|nr:hypothetical protein CYMTET_5070 [Cymbomonas tetramitiformis]